MGKIIITGATGAIGRALITEALRDNKEVLVLVHRNSARAYDLSKIKGCKVLYMDLDEYGHAMEIMEEQGLEKDGYEMFFHLAWRASFGSERNNLEIQLENVQGALAAVKLAHKMGCHTFVGAGSQAEYGRVEGILSPDTPAFPETGYGIAKLCAGQMTRLACEQMGIRHIWTRILSVYGPHDRKDTLISTAVRNMIRDRETSFSPCEQIWDYIYSEDAARAIYQAGKKGKSNSVYMIGSGKTRKLSEYIKIIAELTGYQKEIGFNRRPYNDKQVMYLQADIDSLKMDTGFEPAVEFEEGTARLIEFYKEQDMTDIETRFVEFCRSKEMLVIYGAGKIGKIVESFLRKNEISIFCFCVTRIDEKETFLGYSIKEIAEIQRDFKEAGVVVAVSEKFSKDVLAQVKGLSYFYDRSLLLEIERKQALEEAEKRTETVKVENQVLCTAGKISFQKNIVYFLCPGSIGDTLYVASLVNAYKKKHGVLFVILIVKKSQKSIADLFSSVDGCIVSDELVEILDLYSRNRKVWELENYRYGFAREDLVHNSYMVSYAERNLLSGYKIAIMNLEEEAECEEIEIDKETVVADAFNPKTIIVMPHESSAKRLPLSFWEELCQELSKRYTVYTNTKDETELPIKGTQSISYSLKDMAGICERCFAVISIRTGICDLLAFTKTNLIVLNTEQILAEKWNLKKVFSRDNIVNIDCYENWSPEKLKKDILQQLQEFSPK